MEKVLSAGTTMMGCAPNQKPEPSRTVPWADNQLCRVNEVKCVYTGRWGTKDCRVKLPGHCLANSLNGGGGFTLSDLGAMGYSVISPRGRH